MILTAAGGAGDKAGTGRARWLVEIALFLLFTVAIFQFPEHPGLGVDPSWKMAMGQTFHDGRQFGTEVVYNYGPLGFLMGNTSFGLQFWSLIFWQLFAAMTFAAIILRNGRGLRWELRIIYVLMFLFYGIIYPDALYMITIAFMGIELVRNDKWSWPASAFFALFFAAISLMKFTNLVFASFVIIVVCIYQCRLFRLLEAAWLASWFSCGGLMLWLLCHQNPLNFPAYLRNSWRISTGYEEAMGTPASAHVLWKGIAVLAILGIYMLLHFRLQRNKPRAIASLAILAAFLFLDWKHGFVRADAHMLVFFVSALVPMAAFPALMDDPPRLRWLQRSLLLCAGVISLLAVHNIMQEEETEPPYVSDGLWESIHDNFSNVLDWKSFRASYGSSLQEHKEKSDLPLAREIIGSGTVDLIGNEQTAIFYNGFHYSPRPVFQSFAAYNQPLEQLNYDFLVSSRAPDFVLMKLNAIDERLAALDDALLLRILPRLYAVVIPDEHGYMLWKRRTPQQPSAPVRTLRSIDLALNTPFLLGDLATKNLWVTIDLRPSLLGRLRRFFYKPAMVRLNVGLDDGTSNTYIMPLSQALSGFILNPLIENNADYLAFSKGESTRRIRSLEIEAADAGQPFFNTSAHIEFSELPGANP
ncbi:MAG: hypothetical protein WCD79_09700 [Chthoniobacteraceae bacterium]